MAENFLKSLRSRVLVCDGAMGTELIRRGLGAGVCPETWNVERAAEVAAVHRAYAGAGADIVLTNTFGANRWKLDACGLADEVGKVNAAAVALARKAVGRGVFVAGDIGPTGRFVAPLGPDPRDAFVEVFAEQARALAKAGAEALILETFTSLDEILAALEGAAGTGVPVIASMSFQRAADGSHRTLMGHEAASCAAALDATGAAIIGANCGTGPEDYPDIAKTLCRATKRPVLVEPNAGIPRLVAGKTVFPMTPGQFAKFVRPILKAGARIVGGCCGTTPEHIRAVRRVVDAAG